MNIMEYKIGQEPAPVAMPGSNMINEWKSVYQVGKILRNYSSLTKKKAGNNETIILFPGFMSAESSMLPVKHFLKKTGYDPEYWGLGINKGNVEYYRDKMIEKISKREERNIVLVGWSLGGVIAREVARMIPEKINSVFTFGSPLKGPKFTVGSKVYSEQETERITDLIEALDETQPITTPLSIVFSKNDNVVSWPVCIDPVSPNAKHFEVTSTHLSMVLDPEIWHLLSKHLQSNLKNN